VGGANIGTYVADSSNPTTNISYGAGHGLVDALAALADPRVNATGGSVLPPFSQNPHVYLAGALDVQVVHGVQWTFPAGLNQQVSERFTASGWPSAWPLNQTSQVRFRVAAPGGGLTLLNAAGLLESDGTINFRAPYNFPGAGTYRLEAQYNRTGTWLSWDAFTVRAV
jgi:hypothetical protein